MKHLFGWILFALLMCAQSFGKESKGAEPFTLSIIHMADQEAAMDALFDVPNASSVVNALKDDYENTIIVSSGDNYIAGPFFKASADSAMEEVLGADGVAGRSDILINNYLGIQASVIGNHEFDDGPELFKSLLVPQAEYPGPKFPYLSANLDFSESKLSDLVVKDGQSALEAAGGIARSCVIEVNGKRIGIVGATTPTLPDISSIDGIAVLPKQSADYRSLAKIIQNAVDVLTQEGITIIIVLAHMQDLAIELELATYLRDVDVIIGGGSDSILLDSNDRPRDGDGDLVFGEYPIWRQSIDGHPIAVLNTDGQYRYVGRLVARFDDTGKLLEDYDAQVSGAFATDEQGVAELGNVPPDRKIVEIIDSLKGLILAKDQNILGYTDEYLDARKSIIRTRETNLGELIAGANLWYARKVSGELVDASIANAGGMRASIGIETVLPGDSDVSFLPNAATSYKKEGAISQLDIESAQAFNNELVLVSLTALQIKSILEDGVKFLPTPHGGFPQVAAIDYILNPAAKARVIDSETGELKQRGERVVYLKIGDTVVFEKGEFKVLKDRKFRIVTLAYLANGGNGYPIKGYRDENPELVQYTELKSVSFGDGFSDFAQSGTEQDALAEYLIEKSKH